MMVTSDSMPLKHSERRFLNIAEKCKLIKENKDSTIYEFEVTEENLNLNKTLHGGCISTILEFCMKNAVSHDYQSNGITVDLSVSFLNSAKLGDILVIEIFKIKEGGTLAFVNAEIYRKSDNTFVAIGKQTIAFSNLIQSKL